MSGGSLSSRVKNMKFMQSAGDKQHRDAREAAEKQESKKLKDHSEWRLPINGKTLKIIKSKDKRIKRVGYSTINSIGPVNVRNGDDAVLGRKKMELSAQTPAEAETVGQLKGEDNEVKKTLDGESQDKQKKTKKSKKSKKKSKIMDDFKTESDDFDPTEVDLTSGSLFNLWKAKKK